MIEASLPQSAAIVRLPSSGAIGARPGTADESQKSSDLERASSALEQARQGFADQGKELARQKVERIKERIKALSLIARADPKAAARDAAALAKELDKAVRAYVDAGGSTTIATGVQAPVAAQTRQDRETETDTKTDTAPAQGPDSDGASPARQSEATGTEEPNAGDRLTADRAFLDNARDLLKSLEKIVEIARNEFSFLNDPDEDEDFEKATDALKELRRTLNEVSGALDSGLPAGIDLLA